MALNIMTTQEITELEAKYDALGKQIAMAKLVREKHEEISQAETEFEALKTEKELLETNYREQHGLLSAKVASANAKLASLKDCLLESLVPKKPVVPKRKKPVVESIPYEPDEFFQLLQFSKGGKDYLRLGHLVDGDKVWDEGGYTWLRNEDGSRGPYAGRMFGTKLINTPQIMAEEPELEE